MRYAGNAAAGTMCLIEVPHDSGITAMRRAGWFTALGQMNQRRYEALRAFFVDGLTYEQAGERVRLHSLGDGQPGPRAPGRKARAVRRAEEAPPAGPPVRLTSRNSLRDQQGEATRARGTAPTRRDRRAARHGHALKINPSRTLQVTTLRARKFEARSQSAAGVLGQRAGRHTVSSPYYMEWSQFVIDVNRPII